MLEKFILVFMGGGLGAFARYVLAGWVQQSSGNGFPWGTLAVNVGGSLLIGLVMSLSSRMLWITPQLRLLLATGFLGGFTTFSTFSYETFSLVQDGELAFAGFNVVFTVMACLAGTWAGIAVGRVL